MFSSVEWIRRGKMIISLVTSSPPKLDLVESQHRPMKNRGSNKQNELALEEAFF